MFGGRGPPAFGAGVCARGSPPLPPCASGEGVRGKRIAVAGLALARRALVVGGARGWCRGRPQPLGKNTDRGIAHWACVSLAPTAGGCGRPRLGVADLDSRAYLVA